MPVRCVEDSDGQADRLLDSIDRGLDTFGESVKDVIYWKLENKYHVKRKEIESEPDKFVSSLRDMFGIGSRTVEVKIAEQLRVSFGMPELGSDDLASAIKQIRNRIALH